MRRNARKDALLAALATGGYVAIFYGVGNFTLLNLPSAALVIAGLVLPVMLGVLLVIVAFERSGHGAHVGFATGFLCAGYLLLALRAPIFQIEAVNAIRSELSGGLWWLAHVLYFVVPSMAFGFAFRRRLDKLAAIMCVMAAAALLLAVRGIAQDDRANRNALRALQVRLTGKPDIYLVLADGFGSFTYMNSRGIDVSAFRQGLLERGFHVYDDMFSNYHATTDSMLAMLNMRHHYYQASRKASEVSRSARESIGGKNSLVRVLRENGYRTEYIHQADYLMLQGCTADACFPPKDPLAGARAVFREVLPRAIVGRNRFNRRPVGVLKQQLAANLARDTGASPPRFTYIHLFRPGHAPNALIGRCDEGTILREYARKVTMATDDVTALVDQILTHDAEAVIVVSGDHGPFIANHCGRSADIDTPGEYRDRLGTLMAIRWPPDYDGRFDGRIRTNVNVFRYVLASLAGSGTDALGELESDDAFARGEADVLEVMDGGVLRIPPEHLTAADLRSLYAGHKQ